MTADDITRQPEPARTLADLQPDDADGALSADFDGHDLPAAPDLPDDRFSNRELSWLEFNARVLTQAEDRRMPLLERMKFLAIFASNLDEFYMVRVAGLKRRLDMGLGIRSVGRADRPGDARQVSLRTQELVARHAALWQDDVEPALAGAGIRVLHWDELDAGRAQPAGRVLPGPGLPGAHPARGRPGAPVPVHHRAVAQPGRARPRPGAPGGATERFARVKVPNNVPGSWT